METRYENFKKCGTFPFELLREVNKFGHPLMLVISKLLMLHYVFSKSLNLFTDVNKKHTYLLKLFLNKVTNKNTSLF